MRILIRTYRIFDITDRLMNIQLQKKGPALYDHSLSGGFKSASRVSTPEIVYPPWEDTVRRYPNQNCLQGICHALHLLHK